MNIASLTWQLHTASVRSPSNSRVVTLAAITAITVGSFVSFLLAGGTWMFYQRNQHPERLNPVIQSFDYPEAITIRWVILAFFACCFLVPALIALTAQAAVMGASGRERRLAALRLIGLSPGEINRMTALETGLQSLAGIVLGLLLSVLSLPFFTRLKFQETQIEASELVLPWWGYLAVAAFLFILAVVSALVGMQRVRVSPLGVTRREIPKALRWWRLVVSVVVIAGGFWFVFHAGSNASGIVGLTILGLLLFIMISTLNLLMPFVLQVVAKLMSLLPGTAHYVACRRIFTDGRTAWRRSGTIAFFGVIAGFLMIAPFGDDGLSSMLGAEKEAGLIVGDVARGGLLTLFFGFLIFSIATFLSQSSEVFEKADLSRALARLGVGKSFHFKVAVVEFMGPVVLVSLAGFALGAFFGSAEIQTLGIDEIQAAGGIDLVSRVFKALALLGAGWAVTLVALLATVPLRNRVIDTATRKND